MRREEHEALVTVGKCFHVFGLALCPSVPVFPAASTMHLNAQPQTSGLEREDSGTGWFIRSATDPN